MRKVKFNFGVARCRCDEFMAVVCVAFVCRKPKEVRGGGLEVSEDGDGKYRVTRGKSKANLST